MIDPVGLAAIIASVITAALSAVWKASKWYSEVNSKLLELKEAISRIETNLNNHIVHYDKELSDIADSMERYNAARVSDMSHIKSELEGIRKKMDKR